MTVRLLKGLDNAGRSHTEPKARLEQREIRPLFRRSDGNLDAMVITPRGEGSVKVTRIVSGSKTDPAMKVERHE
jgi:hypothetical protein